MNPSLPFLHSRRSKRLNSQNRANAIMILCSAIRGNYLNEPLLGNREEEGHLVKRRRKAAAASDHPNGVNREPYPPLRKVDFPLPRGNGTL